MTEKRNFSINLIFLLAVNLLVKPVYLFGVEVGVQNAVGAENYGIYYAMFNFTFLFNFLLDIGINNYQKIKVAQNAESGFENMATLIPLKIGLSFVYVIVTLIAAWLIGFESNYWFFIFWLMFNHVLGVFLLMLRANIAGLHLFLRDSVLSVVDRLLLIIAVGYLLVFKADAFSIKHFVVLQSMAYLVAIVLAVFLTPGNQRYLKLDFRWSSMKGMTRQTWPFALLILLMTAYNKLDGIMLERLAPNGAIEAGIYAQAYRILDAGNSFAFLYAGLLLPMFARLLQADHSAESLAQLVDRAARLLIVPAGVVCITTFFWSGWMMDLLYDQHTQKSAESLVWLMGSFVFIAIGYVYGTLITASSKMGWLNMIALLTVLLNVVLNILMIPTFGAKGAAFTSFVSLGFMAVAQILYAHLHFKLKSFTWVLSAVFSWIIIAVIALLVKQSFLGEFGQLMIVLISSMVVFFVLVISPKQIFKE